MNNSDANSNRVQDRETFVTVAVARERMRHGTFGVLGGKGQYRCVLTQIVLRRRNYEKQERFGFEENISNFCSFHSFIISFLVKYAMVLVNST